MRSIKREQTWFVFYIWDQDDDILLCVHNIGEILREFYLRMNYRGIEFLFFKFSDRFDVHTS